MMQDSQKKAEGLSPKVLFEASENREREREGERERETEGYRLLQPSPGERKKDKYKWINVCVYIYILIYERAAFGVYLALLFYSLMFEYLKW